MFWAILKRDTFSGMSKQVDEVKSWRLSDAYAVPGFRVLQRVDGHEGKRPLKAALRG